jgi:L,D-transpeptidase YcbB
MSRLAPKLLVSLACVTLFLGTGAAEANGLFKRRLGFFESLFGNSQPRAPRQTIFGTNSNGERLTWWDEQQLRKNRNNDSNGFYGDPTRKSRQAAKPKKIVEAAPDYAEPEPLPGLGMGIIEYQPPLVAAVFDASFAKLTAEAPEAEAIRNALSKGSTNIRAVETERKAILAMYKANGFKPLWSADAHVSARAIAVLKILAGSAADGLVPQKYQPTTLSSFENAEELVGGDIEKLAAFDIDLTVQVLKYARQLSGGQFEPNRLSLYNDIKPSPVDAAAALHVLAFSPYPEAYLAHLAPAFPQYAIFKEQLGKLSADKTGPVVDAIAVGNTVKPGKTDARIPQVRARLQTLGMMTAEAAVNTNEELLDRPLSMALKAFQQSAKIKQTGALDPATVKAFNTDHRSDERQRLIYNMERLRWLPKNLGSRYVLVNQPAYEVNVMDGGKSVWNSRVIIGRQMNQTYAFSDTIETVVFNPTWGVPASIIVNEYGPKSRKDPGYLDRNGFKVINAKGDIVSSKSINWYTFGQAPNFGVQQPAGDGNALGELKFLFPNAHDIYMHDTPTKNLFAQATRDFSHGCVRVQNPRGFAEVLLGWKQAEIAATISTGESLPVNLKQKIPVHLTYFTAWADADGKIHYYNDIYGRDDAIAKALAYGTNPPKSGDSDKIVQNATIIGGMTQN